MDSEKGHTFNRKCSPPTKNNIFTIFIGTQLMSHALPKDEIFITNLVLLF